MPSYGAAPGQPAPVAPEKRGKGRFIALGRGILALLVIVLFGGCAALIAASSDDSDVAADHRSAMKSAENCSGMMHMSKQGIFDQLTSEYGGKFTTEQADYAIESLDS